MSTRFGEVARERRVEAGLTLRGMAELLGWTPAYVSDIERGNRHPPGVEKARAWARHIGGDVAEFERLALSDRPSVELSLGEGVKSEVAVELARGWDEMTEEQERLLLHAFKRIMAVES